MNQLLPLLPSGPGGVHNLALRGDRQESPGPIITRAQRQGARPRNNQGSARVTIFAS